VSYAPLKQIIEETREYIKSKQYYYNKLQTLDGLFITWDINLNIIDIFIDLSNLLTTLTNLLAWEFEHTFDLLTVRIWDTPKLPYKKAKEWGIFKKQPPFALTKAYYDISKYGYSYYDPPQYVLALLYAIRRYIQRSPYFSPDLHEAEGISEGLDLKKVILIFYNMKMQMMKELAIRQFIVGVTPLGMHPLGEPEIVDVPTLWSMYVPMPLVSIYDGLGGMVVGLFPVGLARVMPRNPEHIRSYGKYEVWNDFVRAISDDVSKQTGIQARNYISFKLLENKPIGEAEMPEILTNIRAELNLLYNSISDLLRDIDNPIELVTYRDFIYEYLYGDTKKHSLYKYGFSYMTEEQYLEYLLNKYTKMGLNREKLVAIANRLAEYRQRIKAKRIKEIEYKAPQPIS
jgi:hypothetical protein